MIRCQVVYTHLQTAEAVLWHPSPILHEKLGVNLRMLRLTPVYPCGGLHSVVLWSCGDMIGDGGGGVE